MALSWLKLDPFNPTASLMTNKNVPAPVSPNVPIAQNDTSQVIQQKIEEYGKQLWTTQPAGVPQTPDWSVTKNAPTMSYADAINPVNVKYKKVYSIIDSGNELFNKYLQDPTVSQTWKKNVMDKVESGEWDENTLNNNIKAFYQSKWVTFEAPQAQKSLAETSWLLVPNEENSFLKGIINAPTKLADTALKGASDIWLAWANIVAQWVNKLTWESTIIPSKTGIYEWLQNKAGWWDFASVTPYAWWPSTTQNVNKAVSGLTWLAFSIAYPITTAWFQWAGETETGRKVIETGMTPARIAVDEALKTETAQNLMAWMTPEEKAQVKSNLELAVIASLTHTAVKTWELTGVNARVWWAIESLKEKVAPTKEVWFKIDETWNVNVKANKAFVESKVEMNPDGTIKLDANGQPIPKAPWFVQKMQDMSKPREQTFVHWEDVWPSAEYFTQKETPKPVKKEWKIGKLADVTVQTLNRMNPTKVTKFVQMTGKQPWEWLRERWIVDTPEKTVEKLVERYQTTKKEADKGLNSIEWDQKYSTTEVEWLDGEKSVYPWDAMADMLSESVEFAETTKSPQTSKLQKLQTKYHESWLTMSEVNEVKRFFERNNKFTYGKDPTSAVKANKSTNIDNAVREWQMNVADENGLTNLREINKETQAARHLADNIADKQLRMSGNNMVSLTDYITGAVWAAHGWIGWVIMDLWIKKALFSDTGKAIGAKILNKISPKEQVKVPKADIQGIKVKQAEKADIKVKQAVKENIEKKVAKTWAPSLPPASWKPTSAKVVNVKPIVPKIEKQEITSKSKIVQPTTTAKLEDKRSGVERQEAKIKQNYKIAEKANKLRQINDNQRSAWALDIAQSIYTELKKGEIDINTAEKAVAKAKKDSKLNTGAYEEWLNRAMVRLADEWYVLDQDGFAVKENQIAKVSEKVETPKVPWKVDTKKYQIVWSKSWKELLSYYSNKGISIPQQVKEFIKWQNFKLKTISIDEVLKNDPDAAEFADSYKSKWYRWNAAPIIIWEWMWRSNAVMDWWHRLAWLKKSWIKTVEAYVSEWFNKKYQISPTTTILEKLGDRETVSKQFISDLTKWQEVKQVEKDIINQVLETMPDKVNVKEFKQAVQNELLPLTSKEMWTLAQYEDISLPRYLKWDVIWYKENVYESPINTQAWRIHFAWRTANYFWHTRFETMKDGTRRIIEVQSDLYQRDRLEKEKNRIPFKSYTWEDFIDETDATIEELNKDIADIKSDTWYKKSLIEQRDALIKRGKEFSQLQQYSNPTAHFRMTREELAKAKTDWVKKVQFPTGKTAMDIEWLWHAWDKFEIVWDNTSLTEKDIIPWKLIKKWWQEYLIVENKWDGKFTAYSTHSLDIVWINKFSKLLREKDLVAQKLIDYQKTLDKWFDEWNKWTPPGLEDWNEYHDKSDKLDYIDRFAESYDIKPNYDTSNPIYKFYDKTLWDYLKKNYNAQLVTDAQWVTWYEVDTANVKEWPVTAFQKPDTWYQTQIATKYWKEAGIPETDINKAVAEIKKVYPDAKISIHDKLTTDSWQEVAGWYDKETDTIVLSKSAINKTTAWHETGHRWLGIIKDTNPEMYKRIEEAAKEQYQAEDWEEPLAEEIHYFSENGKFRTGNLKTALKEFIKNIVNKIKWLFWKDDPLRTFFNDVLNGNIKGEAKTGAWIKLQKYVWDEYLRVTAKKYKTFDEFFKALEDNNKLAYHGSYTSIDKFDTRYSWTTTWNNEQEVFYFTKDSYIGEQYSKEAFVRMNEWEYWEKYWWDNVMEKLYNDAEKNIHINPAFIKMDNPAVKDWKWESLAGRWEEAYDFIQEAKWEWKDWVVFKNIRDDINPESDYPQTEVLAFYPEQIITKADIQKIYEESKLKYQLAWEKVIWEYKWQKITLDFKDSSNIQIGFSGKNAWQNWWISATKNLESISKQEAPNYPWYMWIKKVAVGNEFRKQWYATELYKKLLDNLPEDVKWIVWISNAMQDYTKVSKIYKSLWWKQDNYWNWILNKSDTKKYQLVPSIDAMKVERSFLMDKFEKTGKAEEKKELGDRIQELTKKINWPKVPKLKPKS